jgi:hypothetical protein
MRPISYNNFFLTLLAAAAAPIADCFSSVLFREAPTLQVTAPSTQEGVDIELPDFNELFGRIQEVSPLARSVIQGTNMGDRKGFASIDDKASSLKWKTLEANRKKTIHQIEKIDNFQGHHAPILRFRSTLQGPCIGEFFANFLMDLEERKKWDDQIEQVYERYPLYDLDAANIAMGFGRYGDCSRLGVGYCQTRANVVADSREQLTLCGIQDFHRDGSCIIWGVEMEDWHNHLLPPGHRHTRAKSHIFCTTLTPTSDDSFDVEYVLQLEIGGNIPVFLTTPIVTETVKKLFRSAEIKFSGRDGALQEFLTEKAHKDSFADIRSLLMTP